MILIECSWCRGRCSLHSPHLNTSLSRYGQSLITEDRQARVRFRARPRKVGLADHYFTTSKAMSRRCGLPVQEARRSSHARSQNTIMNTPKITFGQYGGRPFRVVTDWVRYLRVLRPRSPAPNRFPRIKVLFVKFFCVEYLIMQALVWTHIYSNLVFLTARNDEGF